MALLDKLGFTQTDFEFVAPEDDISINVLNQCLVKRTIGKFNGKALVLEFEAQITKGGKPIVDSEFINGAITLNSESEGGHLWRPISWTFMDLLHIRSTKTCVVSIDLTNVPYLLLDKVRIVKFYPR